MLRLRFLQPKVRIILPVRPPDNSEFGRGLLPDDFLAELPWISDFDLSNPADQAKLRIILRVSNVKGQVFSVCSTTDAQRKALATFSSFPTSDEDGVWNLRQAKRDREIDPSSPERPRDWTVALERWKHFDVTRQGFAVLPQQKRHVGGQVIRGIVDFPFVPSTLSGGRLGAYSERRQHLLHSVDGQREADPFNGLTQYRLYLNGRHSDDVAGRVQQRSSAIAWVDSGIGLDPIKPGDVSSRRDYAPSDSKFLTKHIAERESYGDDILTKGNQIGIPELHMRV